MKAGRTTAAGRFVIIGTMLALGALAGAPAAPAHEGGSKCTAELELRGNTWENTCSTTFQGFPIGLAGVYDSAPGSEDPKTKPAEIHVEVMAQMADGAQRPLGVECEEITKGEARCNLEYNPLGTPVSGPEPVPEEVVAIVCKAHSHAKFTRLAPPAGRFACWTTDAAREDLKADGWFADNGFEEDPDVEPDPEPKPEPEPTPGPLAPLTGLGVSGRVTTVPFNTYLPSSIQVSRSLGLTYVNVDTARHDVVALEARRPDGSAPWCGSFENPEDPDAKDCPLFWTPLIPGGGSETPVLGLEDTKAGESYAFYCSIHPYMTGTLEVVE
jgi:plastocyanin